MGIERGDPSGEHDKIVEPFHEDVNELLGRFTELNDRLKKEPKDAALKKEVAELKKRISSLQEKKDLDDQALSAAEASAKSGDPGRLEAEEQAHQGKRSGRKPKKVELDKEFLAHGEKAWETAENLKEKLQQVRMAFDQLGRVNDDIEANSEEIVDSAGFREQAKKITEQAITDAAEAMGQSIPAYSLENMIENVQSILDAFEGTVDQLEEAKTILGEAFDRLLQVNEEIQQQI